MVARIEHLNRQQREAHGAGGPRPGRPVGTSGLVRRPEPEGPGRADRGAERQARRRPGPGPAWPDDGIAVHVLPWRREDHGGRPRRDPTAGLEVQLCGDAHLSNFGVFGSPERRLVFDINDFDETLPGPFEYDVKRLAASLTVAAYNNGFSRSDARSVTRETVGRTGRRWPVLDDEDPRRVVRPHVRGRASSGRQRAAAAVTARRTESGGKGKAAAKEIKKAGSASRRTSRRLTPATAFRLCRS